MGDRFLALPPSLQQFHGFSGTHVFLGWAEIAAPVSLPARLLARWLRTPLQSRHGPISFELTAVDGHEIWTRQFPDNTMVSRFFEADGHVVEQWGAAHLRFRLVGGSEGLSMNLVSLRFFGIRCPNWLMPDILAEEAASPGKLHFRVQVNLPLIGMVVGYAGYLNVVEGAAT